jgi:hypothetical protein
MVAAASTAYAGTADAVTTNRTFINYREFGIIKMSLRVSAASEAISTFLAYNEIASSVEIGKTQFQPPRKDKSPYPELMLNIRPRRLSSNL